MADQQHTEDSPAVRLSPHAADELRRRGIPGSLLEQTVAAPEQEFEVRRGRVVRQSRFVEAGQTYLLRVFIDIDRTPAVVVTMYRTTKIEKYWRTP